MNLKQPIASSSPFYFLFYVLVILLTSTIISAFYDGKNETDHKALLHIKLMITKDPYGALTSWNNSLHFCDWTGVTCGKRHRRVTAIVLESQGLEGMLSPHVTNLSFLRVLSIGNNSFTGAIPYKLSGLSRLRFLYLSRNKFNGIIPTNLSSCSNLEELILSRNELVGNIPEEISLLPKLTYLSLSYNKLTGGIPPFLGNSTSMKILSLAINPLGGSIPNTLGHWEVLKELYFGGCNLSGTIPESLYNLSLLMNFSLASNQLTGSLPPTIGAMLPNLVFFQISENQLTGPLPPSISNFSKLRHLQVHDNHFSGKLTTNFEKLTDIYYLDITNNLFGSEDANEMMFIDSMKNCTKLKTLALANCNFQGVLPTSIGNLSNQLRILFLQNNELHGNIPSSIGNLVGLELLYSGSNRFTGNIPSTIGKLQNLQEAQFYKNRLSGQIPDSIGNLSSLIYLDLYSNKLEGVIPSSLGNCHNLLMLYLGDNKLNGKIPTQVFQLSSLSIELALSHNNLCGPLPTEVGDLKMLSKLDLSYNNLSGNIPSSLGGCASLSWLYLEGNLFQGTIPPSLSSLKGLVELDISQNNLSGDIPQFLERFSNLKYLNLSYNDFESEVPMVGLFANASGFSILGNSRLCGGIVELGLSKCKGKTKSKKKFHVFVIPILIASTLFTITCFAYAWCKNKRKSQQSQPSTNERFMKVSYDQLLKATNGFSEANLIGKGGFSSVYKGILDEDDDRFVAVKVLHLHNRGAQRSFMRECEAWRSIRHRNLLRIITSCSSIDFQGNDFKALVYEFMPKGSLHDWLHSSESTSRLNLLQILNILIDVASVLDYIHNQCVPPVVHGDIKPSNILLDDDMVAHVGDFGLARFLGTSYSNSSTGTRGTIGYVAPEYGLGNEMTSNGDVYSFGILLLEAMSGKKPTGDIFNESLSLHNFVSMALPDHVMDVIDLNILNVYQEDETFMQKKEETMMKIEDCLRSILKIGVSSTMDSPLERMDMKNVVHELKHILVKIQNI
ncbi:putative protein kinase RLK-Pelle-LRR-XII-1 family [Helianthus annuus]|uniref:non-specific serine/threonine protein kinase n=2 Tax=Helianthus annuus TaxID=4232 RepID=A0A251TR70_HELAN|nr:putative protein kinase RLK-Pelle-LRR-XII-1 family [Helianthus annuus]KAJ0532192.1 putative protein kinase RLK-Pelle-LRR-XII-1 family [Helianthus annuus]KAJ0891323.1 putative protein kinase RLK-Pelle-LRR-XII-1 family [Helianthus annuus]